MTPKGNSSTQPPPESSFSSPATAPPSFQSNSATPFSPSSSFSKYELLLEWWLIKSDSDSGGKRLAVGGLNAHGKQAVRVFTSAPIVTRFDTYTVETADGITVRIQGFINKTRSHLNGIPPEVSQYFLIGFPYNWDKYANGDFGEIPTSPAISKRSPDTNRQLEQHLSDISAVERDSNKLLPLERDDSHHKLERGLGGYALRSRDRLKKSGVENAGASENSLGRRKDSDENDANLSRMKKSIASELSTKATNKMGNSHNSRKHTIRSGVVKHSGIKHARSVTADGQEVIFFSSPESSSKHHLKTPASCDVISKKSVDYSKHNVSLGKSGKTASFKTVIQCSIKHAIHSDSSAQLHSVKASFGELPTTHDSEKLTEEEQTRGRKEHASTRKTIWKPSYTLESPLTRDKAKKLSVTSPELLDLKRSRSGRLLVPPLARWCQKIIYDTHGSITGLAGLDELNSTCKGSMSEQPKRKKLM